MSLHVLSDLDSLLALIYFSSTKLSLARDPSTSVLDEHVAALAHCARLFHDDIHGATLSKDVRNRVRDIIDALRTLTQAFLNGGQDYLVRTGALHHLITDARSPNGIPKDNQTAVYRAWKSDKESLDDNLQEIGNMISDAESDDDPPDDDGWDEIGLGHTTRFDKVELARAKNVHHLLRLTTLFHKRIFLDLLPDSSSAPPSAFDALLLQSNHLLSASDDLVAAIYTPQDPAHVREQILEITTVVTALQSQIAVFLPDQLASQLHGLGLGTATTSTPPTKKKADKKWFDTCVDQIRRMSTTMSEESTRADKPNSTA